eukprot:TRINITY_DN64693_c0_g1_i1.p1 TRINITY_DN64693_c0_g1~~TRINITY_DN64693_c0_g1_i1.p1  ORF type:complete len:449 (-),score=39.33 TRINITY_DN64693_c0_g1_i1:126-1472(-)
MIEHICYVLQMGTFTWHVAILVVWTHIWRALGGRTPQDHRRNNGGRTVLHVIGDTHGDENYLVRCLLSTELFYLSSTTVEWRSDLAKFPKFEVVILGDMIDRGLSSKKVLQLLARLNKQEPFGKHLHVLLGNHEDMTLRYLMKEWVDLGVAHYMVGDWDMNDRKMALRAKLGTEDYKLIEWLRTRDVAYLHEGTIMMHGGLSSEVVNHYIKKEHMPYSAACAVRGAARGAGCAASLVDFFNNDAKRFYDEMHECIQCAKPPTFSNKTRSAKNAFKCGHRAYDRAKKVESPAFLDAELGILTYRGYSAIQNGANTVQACKVARNVGLQIGAKDMLLAHTTHPFIVEYCAPKVVPFAFPIFVTDTHRTDCMFQTPPECDFDPTYSFHADVIDSSRGNVPQSLRMTEVESAQTCLSRVVPGEDGSTSVEVTCEPVRMITPEDVELSPTEDS